MNLNEIQQKLKAPKGQKNNFGNYKYRSCEDILEAVKPLLGDAVLIINDEIVEIAGRVYVKATATLYYDVSIDIPNNRRKKASATAYAREPLTKKGMDEAQITGATSSYARKYALNGLFCIDDTKDADVEEEKPTVKSKHVETPKPVEKVVEKVKPKTTTNFKFLKAMGEMKEKAGDRMYYKILSKHKHKHANEIVDSGKQKEIYRELSVFIQDRIVSIEKLKKSGLVK